MDITVALCSLQVCSLASHKLGAWAR